jgi:hypothetical protein
MGKVRPFVKEDIAQVVDLHPRAFTDSNHPPPGYFEEVFFHNPWVDKAMPSLVYEEDRRITGFLGVVPCRLSLGDQPINAATSSHLMVDRFSRSSLAAFQLQKTFFAGPQDLSIAAIVNEVGRRVASIFRMETVWVHNIQWTRQLRPSPSKPVENLLKQARAPSALAAAARPLDLAIDHMTGRIRGKSQRPVPPQVKTIEIDEDVMAEHLPCLVGRDSLRPDYDGHSLKWLLKRAATKTRYGRLEKIGVLNTACELVGWYLYYSEPGGRGLVLQIAAREHLLNEVLDSLFHHAWERGTEAVYGRLEPRLIPSLVSKQGMAYHLSRYSMMVHSKNPELLSKSHRGDAFLSQLEGEWATAFHGEQYE